MRCPNCDTAVLVPELRAETAASAPAEPPARLAAPLAGMTASPGSGESSARPEVAALPPARQSPAPQPPMPQPAAAPPAPEAEEDEDDQVLPPGNRPEDEMDMTPMVDVTFLLLIFFMVTAAFSLQKSIKMPRQQTDAPSTSVVEQETEDLDMVEVQVDEFGSFLVMAADWERETPGKLNLITALQEAIAGRTSGMRLVVKVHEMAKLGSLVDAMDAGTIAGFTELEVTQVESFD